jgi:hypothetical protein
VRIAVGVLNLVLGFVYIQYGTLTIVDMRRHWRTSGFSHFGAAWIAMAFTCGPHHFVHGLHMLISGSRAGRLDIVAVAVGFPAGVTWFLLRVEAFAGGRGDRFIAGSPAWVLSLPTMFGMYITAVGAAAISAGISSPGELALVAPNVLLVVIYSMIGYYLLRTQIANRRPLGGWSVSGLALAVIFPTCAAMHAVYAYYAVTGRYGIMASGVGIDWFAVPAGIYFLWVVQALYKGSYLDWNSVRALREEVPAT